MNTCVLEKNKLNNNRYPLYIVLTYHCSIEKQQQSTGITLVRYFLLGMKEKKIHTRF